MSSRLDHFERENKERMQALEDRHCARERYLENSVSLVFLFIRRLFWYNFSPFLISQSCCPSIYKTGAYNHSMHSGPYNQQTLFLTPLSAAYPQQHHQMDTQVSLSP